MTLTTIVGVLAAVLTTISYFPQLMKCWRTGRAADLSFTMFSVLSAGIGCWVVYGILRNDVIIIVANSISLACLCGILAFKIQPTRKWIRSFHR
ncbi:MAG: SemiSWEET family sugar transporter [Pseudolabrys sp.]